MLKPYKLNDHQIGSVVSKVVKDVPIVNQYYTSSIGKIKAIILNNIQKDYIELCEFIERPMAIDEYIKDKEESFGWDWVLKE